MADKEQEAVNRLVDVVLELKNAGYGIQTFKVKDEKNFAGTAWRQIKITAARYIGSDDTGLNLSGLFSGDTP
jgi:hypothetical protein